VVGLIKAGILKDDGNGTLLLTALTVTALVSIERPGISIHHDCFSGIA